MRPHQLATPRDRQDGLPAQGCEETERAIDHRWSHEITRNHTTFENAIIRNTIKIPRNYCKIDQAHTKNNTKSYQKTFQCNAKSHIVSRNHKKQNTQNHSNHIKARTIKPNHLKISQNHISRTKSQETPQHMNRTPHTIIRWNRNKPPEKSTTSHKTTRKLNKIPTDHSKSQQNHIKIRGIKQKHTKTHKSQ